MRLTLSAVVMVAAALMCMVPVAAQSPSPAASVRETAAASVRVERGLYTVTADFNVAESLAIVRAVLTDYERIPAFLPNVEKSVIVSRESGHVRVEQEVAGRMMMFSKRICLKLDIREEATAIYFIDTCRKQFSSYEGEWQIDAAPAHTTVHYRVTANPSFSVPSFLLSRMLKHDAEKLIAALQVEMTARAKR